MEIPTPETARQKQLEALFPEFVAMGERRSYGALGRKHGIEGWELLGHARKFAWAARINQAAIRTNEATAVDTHVAGASEVNRTHLTRLMLLQKKAMDYLENVVFDKPDTALRMLIESMKLEREIKGLTKDKVDDLRSVLLERIGELDKPQDTAAEPDFNYNPQMPIEDIEDGPARDPAPPSGGDHAEQ